MRLFNALLFFLAVSVVLLSGCLLDQGAAPPVYRSDFSQPLRAQTSASCQSLLNQSSFSGSVAFEECGKNCLGGCPNTGPDYCYYAIRDANGCLVYAKSRTVQPAFTDCSDENGQEKCVDRPEQVLSVARKFSANQSVSLNGSIRSYVNYYCANDYCLTKYGSQYSDAGSGECQEKPEGGHATGPAKCSYFVIDDWFTPGS